MTPNPLSGARGYARHAVAVAAVLATYAMARNPVLPEDARAELASRFAFQRRTLPTAGPVSSRTIRPVHPERARIRAWISGVGGAVALHDLDSDGLSNDACWVDTRSD